MGEVAGGVGGERVGTQCGVASYERVEGLHMWRVFLRLRGIQIVC